MQKKRFIAVSVSFGLAIVGGAIWYMQSQQLQQSKPQDSDYSTHSVNGSAAMAREDFATARQEYTEAARLVAEKYGFEDKRYFDTLKRLAWVHDYVGDLHLSRKLYESMYHLSSEESMKLKTIQILFVPMSGTASVGSETDKETVGNPVLTNADKIYMLKTCEMMEQILGPVPLELHALTKLATNYGATNEGQLEEETYARIESIYRQTEGEKSVGMARAKIMLAQMYQRQKNSKMAQSCYDEAIAIYKEVLGAESSKKVADVVALSKAPPKVFKEPKPLNAADLTIPKF